MATVPVTRTWVAGEVVTAGYMNNNITAVLNWLLAPALCQVRQLVAQTPASGATNVFTFTAEDVDTTGMHSTTVDTNRLTAVYPGWYLASGVGVWNFHATGRRVSGWRINGTNVTASFTGFAATASGTCSAPVRTMLVFLNVGDYLELVGVQNSGGVLSTATGAVEDLSSASVVWQSN